MEELCYKFSELQAITRLTAAFMADSGFMSGTTFLSQLAVLFGADFAGVIQLQADRLLKYEIRLVNRSASCRALQETRKALTLLSHDQQMGTVHKTILAGNLLASAQPLSQSTFCVLVLHRPNRPFEGKDERTLQMIHGIIHPKLTRCRQDASCSDHGLPRRLQQVHQGLLDGLSDKEMAVRLQISPHTIHVYVKSLFKHFEVNSRGELLSETFKRGLLSVQGQACEVRSNDQVPGSQFQHRLQNIAPATPMFNPAPLGKSLFNTL